MSIDPNWHYRLFFSVDIENSTAFKYSKTLKKEGEANSSDWVWGMYFQNFLDNFADIFYNENEEFISKLKDTAIEINSIDIWKFLGDEVIFVVEITDLRAVLWHIYAFKNAVYKQNTEKKNDGMKCKGTIWGAGFPINNFPLSGLHDSDDPNEKVEDEFLKRKKQLLSKEYIGANIDAGFRLTKFSTTRYLTIAIEIAYLLSTSWIKQDPSAQTQNMHFPDITYNGRQVLKGIFFNKPYPLFSIDTHYDEPPNENLWLNGDKFCKPKEIGPFCDHFFDKESFFAKPFIPDDKSGTLGAIPEDMEKKLSLIKSNLTGQPSYTEAPESHNGELEVQDKKLTDFIDDATDDGASTKSP